MSDVTDYKHLWENNYQKAYAEGRRHWRPELATPPPFVEFMESKWAPAKGARILEAGCGDGLNAIHLARAGYTVTGVDVSEAAIARAREAAGEQDARVEFLCLDLVRERVPGVGEYDLWVDIKTLHVLWEDSDRQSYLALAASALRPGGVLFLQCGLAIRDVREYFPEVFAALDAQTQAWADIIASELPKEKRTGIRCETQDGYCRELEQAGLKIRESKREASLQSGWGVIIVAQKTT